MKTPDDDAIARRAHGIWLAEGRPEGRDKEHWFKALRQLSGGDESTDAPSDPDLPGSPGTSSEGLESGEGIPFRGGPMPKPAAPAQSEKQEEDNGQGDIRSRRARWWLRL